MSKQCTTKIAPGSIFSSIGVIYLGPHHEGEKVVALKFCFMQTVTREDPPSYSPIITVSCTQAVNNEFHVTLASPLTHKKKRFTFKQPAAPTNWNEPEVTYEDDQS